MQDCTGRMTIVFDHVWSGSELFQKHLHTNNKLKFVSVIFVCVCKSVYCLKYYK